MKEDAKPFAVHTPRVIPFARQDDVKKDSMVAQGIITPADNEPSKWCHPLVAVGKPRGGVRITVDLAKLNRQVLRPVHPSPTPRCCTSYRPKGPVLLYYGCLKWVLAVTLRGARPTLNNFHHS